MYAQFTSCVQQVDGIFDHLNFSQNIVGYFKACYSPKGHHYLLIRSNTKKSTCPKILAKVSVIECFFSDAFNTDTFSFITKRPQLVLFGILRIY